MKRHHTLLLIALLALLSTPTHASDSTPPESAEEAEFTTLTIYSDPADTLTRSGKGRLEIAVNSRLTRKSDKSSTGWNGGHWAGITLHYNGLVESLGSLSLPSDASWMSLESKSMGVALNPIDLTLLHSDRVGLVSGLGFELNNFRFRENMAMTSTASGAEPLYYDPTEVNITKSKLFVCYMNIPLLLEVQLGKRNHTYISGGVIGGMNIGAHTKVNATSASFNGTDKTHGDLNLRNFHCGYTLNFGYNRVGISAVYYPSGLFRIGEGPSVEQINIGISLLL